MALWFILFILTLVSPALATEWHISTTGSDGASCLPGAPCATWNHVRANKVQSGDTVYFRQGTYTQTIGATGDNNLASGTGVNNRTLIAGYPGETVTLLGAGIGLAYYPGVNHVNGVIRYVTFKNFRLDGNGGQNGGIGILGCNPTSLANLDLSCGPHFIRFEDIETTNNQYSGVGCGNGASDIEFIRIHTHHNGSDRGDHGYYVGCFRMLIEDNNIHDNNGYGIQVFESAEISPGVPQPCIPDCATDSVIRNNYIYDNHHILNEGQVTLQRGRNMQFYNNVVIGDTAGQGRGGWGINANSDANEVKIWNNTFVASGGVDLFGFSAASGHVVQNNIIVSGNPVNFGNASNTTVDHNLCNFTAAGWCTAGNPAFVGGGATPTDLSAAYNISAGSPAINAGVTLTAFNTDKEGHSRGQGAWDIGAYEFSSGGPTCPPDCPPPTCPPDCPVSGNPIYVAQTGGTPTTDCIAAENEATPIRTIAGGLACMGTTPGKVMNIKAGTYTDCIDTSSLHIRGGNGPGYDTATIIQSYGNDLVTIKPTSCSNGVAVFLQNGANDKFIVFRGSAANKLVFDGTNTDNNVVLYPGADHIRFEFVEFKNSIFWEALLLAQVTNVDIVDSYIHGAASQGITLTGTSSNILVEKTEITFNGTRGIDSSTGSVNNLNIRRDKIHHNGTDGILVGTSTGLAIVNNLVYDNEGKGIWLATGASGSKLHSNTLFSNTGTGLQCDAGATTTDIINNIFTSNGTNLTNNCSATDISNSTSATFVAPGTDFHLADGSAGIDTGTDLSVSNPIDYEGTSRTNVGGTFSPYDIGAYAKTQATPAGPNVTVSLPSPRQAGMFLDK